jgi:hypothetical protein
MYVNNAEKLPLTVLTSERVLILPKKIYWKNREDKKSKCNQNANVYVLSNLEQAA